MKSKTSLEIDKALFAKYYDTNIRLYDWQFDTLIEYIHWKYENNQLLLIGNNGGDGFDGFHIICDNELLNKEINLDCFNCENRFGCCNGSPINISIKNMNNLKKYMDIGNKINKFGYIRHSNRQCHFLVNDNGVYKCQIRKLAIDKGLDKCDIGCLSCLMFPMDIIEFIRNDFVVYYVTSVLDNDYWRSFGRWGSYFDIKGFSTKCLDKKQHGTDTFKLSEYRPVWEVNKDLLTHVFNGKIYDVIKYWYS